VRRLCLVLVLAGAVALPTSVAARPGRNHDGVLVALLLPLKGATEHAAVRLRGTSVLARVQSARAGQSYEFALSRRGCKATPKLIGHEFAAIHAEKNQDIAVENDEAHFTRRQLRAARSVVLLVREDKRAVPAACGAASIVGTGAGSLVGLTQTAGSGVAGLATARIAHGRLRLRAAVTCKTAARCRLMEEEGIFYLARRPCRRPRAAGQRGSIHGGVTRRRGNGFVTGLTIDPFSTARKVRSLRLSLRGREQACGKVR
jgi:hypothetical protein